MPNFDELLDRDFTEFERPPVLPEGEYIGFVKAKNFGQSTQKKTPFVRYDFGVTEAKDSVPADLLEDIDLAKAKFKDEFYLTDDAMFRLREFLDLFGLESMKTREAIDAVVGQPIGFTIGHETNQKDASKKYAVIRGYFKPE